MRTPTQPSGLPIDELNHLLQYDTLSLQGAIPEESNLTFTFTEAWLDDKTAALAQGHEAVCLFANDAIARLLSFYNVIMT